MIFETLYKETMTDEERLDFEAKLKGEFQEYKTETDKDLSFRIGGVPATRGSSGYQFVGYETLGQFYRGDQWDHDEPPGASQRTDNYCASIVDNFSSLLFDAPVEINCPAQDETDDILEIKAEIKEKLLKKVYEDNDADDIVFPEMSKCGSLYGDSFLKGPLLDKNGSTSKKDWRIVFFNIENPANVRPIFLDSNYKKLYGFIESTPVSPMYVAKHYKNNLVQRGISYDALVKQAISRASTNKRSLPNINTQNTNQKMITKFEFWTDKIMAVFIEDQLVDWYWHDWGFVPLRYVKNIYVPNHPYGKSDLEDAIDPQLSYTATNNDLANAVKFLSTINLKGKNLDGMEVLVHGLSKIFNLPAEGELDPIQRSGDPYASDNFVSRRRNAVLDISGLSEALMSSGLSGQASGRALSLSLQSVIRRITPRIKRYQQALRELNKDIFKLMEIYWPETKEIIMGDHTSEVNIISTLLRNIVDEISKMQSGVQSLTTTQKNLGIPQPRIEQKIMKRDLMDPVLGPQFARQPGILTQISMANPGGSEEGTPGSEGQGMASIPNQGGAPQGSPQGNMTANNQRAGGGAPAIAAE